jgi:protein TonB
MISRRAAAVLAATLLPIGLAQEATKKVSHAESMAAAITKVAPEYPSLARQLKIEGSVELDAVVSEDGTVQGVNIVSGNAVLTKPASEALKKWKFKPFVVDGQTVKVLARVSLSFKL